MTSREPSRFVRAAHEEETQTLPFDDTTDFDDAERGFLGTLDPLTIPGDPGFEIVLP